jgi:hypothetical protein
MKDDGMWPEPAAERPWTYDWADTRDHPRWERASKTWATAAEAAEAGRSFCLSALAYLGRAPMIHVVKV